MCKIESICEGIKTSHVDAILIEIKHPIWSCNIPCPSKPKGGKSGRLWNETFHMHVRIINAIASSKSQIYRPSLYCNAKGAHVRSWIDSLNESTSCPNHCNMCWVELVLMSRDRIYDKRTNKSPAQFMQPTPPQSKLDSCILMFISQLKLIGILRTLNSPRERTHHGKNYLSSRG